MKPGCTATEDRKRLEIFDLERRGIVPSKVLISCTFTAKLISAFVFACAKIRFSHDAVNFIFETRRCTMIKDKNQKGIRKEKKEEEGEESELQKKDLI